MKYTRKDLDKGKVEISVVSTTEELQEAEKRAVEKLGKDIKVKGFRAGKAPANLLASQIDPEKLTDEIVNDMINRALVDVLVKEQVHLLDQPNVNVTKFVPFTTLEFTMTLPIVPEVKLGDYMNLKVKREKVSVKAADVDKAIEQLKKNFAEKKVVKRAAKEGDEVTIDFTGMRDDKPFDGGAAKDFPLQLGSKSFIPGFEEGIVGKKAGDGFDLPLTFPKDYHVDSLAGVDVVFKVKVHKVSELVEPEVDDKFAAKVGPFKTVKEMKEAIKKELTDRANYEADEKFKTALLDKLAEKSDVEIPKVLVDDQMKALENDFRQNLAYSQMTPEQYYKSAGYKNHGDWVEKELRPQAEKRVKNGMILGELSKVEKIEVSDDMVKQRQQEMVQQYNNPELIKQFESPEVRRKIENDLAINEALNRLMKYNQDN